MKSLFQRALVCGLVVALSGCVAAVPGRVKTPDVTVVTVPTAIASVIKAEAFVENGRLVVAGTVRRLHEVKLPGHVDVVVCGPEELLERRSVKVAGLSSNRKGRLSLRFATRLDLVPPPGSTVTVRYHAPPLGDENALECI